MFISSKESSVDLPSSNFHNLGLMWRFIVIVLRGLCTFFTYTRSSSKTPRAVVDIKVLPRYATPPRPTPTHNDLRELRRWSPKRLDPDPLAPRRHVFQPSASSTKHIGRWYLSLFLVVRSYDCTHNLCTTGSFHCHRMFHLFFLRFLSFKFKQFGMFSLLLREKVDMFPTFDLNKDSQLFSYT